MKAIEVTEEYILFNNGKKLSCRLAVPNESSENIYFIDFLSLRNVIMEREFVEDQFECFPPTHICCDFEDEPFGFCFGDKRWPHYYVHLFVMENPEFDWDSSDLADNPYPVTIFYGDKEVLRLSHRRFMEIPCQYHASKTPVTYDHKTAMKICEVTSEYIKFTNGKKITYDHVRDCCEHNYADFEQIDDIARAAVYFENELIFEPIENAGFRFGNRGGFMAFVPCYSEQNGHYTEQIDIFYGYFPVLHLEHAKADY